MPAVFADYYLSEALLRYRTHLDGDRSADSRADGGVCLVHDEQADVYKEGSLERDWIFGEVELDRWAFVLSTSARILLERTSNVVFDEFELTAWLTCRGFFSSELNEMYTTIFTHRANKSVPEPGGQAESIVMHFLVPIDICSNNATLILIY